jgi:predicted AAA+ superfamily ATPase
MYFYGSIRKSSIMILREIEKELISKLTDNKILIVLGPRQVGKTFLLNKITLDKKQMMWLSGDDTDTREWLSNPNATKLKGLIGNCKILVIDEAQRIENIGLCLKIIYDQIKDVKVLATGSSAFELANKINEPLTGRKWEYNLYPLSFSEMANHTSLRDETRMLENRLIYGYYPEVVNNMNHATELLKQLTNSYLYKDILTWERIQKPDKMERLLQALAFQVGNQVSYNELGVTCGLNSETVEHYINLLEKAFIIFRLGTFSRNLRNELKKTRKIYFYDNGLRNAVINQFSPLNIRNDIGALWENFLISERLKNNSYKKNYVNKYFWRSKTQQEIDYVEEKNGKVYAYEFKWNSNAKVKFPSSFVETYHPETQVISKDNFIEFIS